MTQSPAGSRGTFLGLLGLSLGAPLFVSAQPVNRIVHHPPACVVRSVSGFPLIRATLLPSGGEPASVRVHVRAAAHPGFYQLDLVEKGGGGDYEGVLPEPSAETKEIVYFIQVADESYQESVTPVYRVPVVEQVPATCSGEMAPAAGGPPGVLTPDEAGSPPFPPGFDAPAGLASPSVRGDTTEETTQKRSKKKGVLIALGAAAGAVVGLGLLTTASETATTPPGPPTPPPQPPEPPPPIIPTPTPVRACFELPLSGRVGEPVRIDASCSSPRGSIGTSGSSVTVGLARDA